MAQVIKLVATAVGCIIVVLMIALAVDYLLSLPLVYIRATTEECVKVVSPSNNYTCDKLPESYTTVYVK